MYCAKVEPIVNELAKTYAGKMKLGVKNYQEGDSPAEIKKFELDTHGMVITDAEGKKLWSESGHKQTREGVEAAIKKVLAGD